MAALRATGSQSWDLNALWAHLQSAVDLEFWTIPYYMTAMYSIQDPSSEPYQLIRSIVIQEMLHTQLACNIANAYGYSPAFPAPSYRGRKVPHLQFRLDEPNPTARFSPYSAELGPLDALRLNTMCLIEYPEWDTERTPDLRPQQEQYGSIGELYAALRAGLAELRDEVRGDRRQVDFFSSFYQDFSQPTISRDGDAGYRQAVEMIDLITDQGEGQTQGDAEVPVEFRNTADGMHEAWPHFRKFMQIRALGQRFGTFQGVASPPREGPGHAAQERLVHDFDAFRGILERIFRGERAEPFGPLMAKLGGDILTCWQHGAIPRFS